MPVGLDISTSRFAATRPGMLAPSATGRFAAVPDQHSKLVDQARQWLGLTFFGPILKQAREDPFKSKLLDGGNGGETFGSMLDQQLAQHMTRGAGSKLLNGIVRRLEAKKSESSKSEARKAYDKQKTQPNPGALGPRGDSRNQEQYKMDIEREGADRTGPMAASIAGTLES